ncbi:GH92 family glycosyl hydrolase [Aliifodinibius sp. S!AR15-10]|uniref:GH92 family glycosyl hydrolase n=1 Tax=Aliifodinibius sp. S!AR15-10 TaxID=2950437 RepID=UPI0028583280|nr:GH92 family glycosyl hydrolase [Aliifodinibius sp. S!AR15-10]MDR8392720.1 GH92 family glycosyl hydrolase [Aliifodinibius sp. S!AR15-10]
MMKKYVLWLITLSVLLGVSFSTGYGQKRAKEPVDYVDPLIDTHQSRWFYFSSASRPFGMVNLSPDTQTRGSWDSGYRYGDRYIHTFSHIHAWQMSGIPVMPTTGPMTGHKGYEAYKSSFSHRDEVVKPGYHKVVLEDYDIEVELTSTKRVGFHRYRYPSSENAYILFDLGAYLGHGPMQDAMIHQVSNREVAGYAVMAPTSRRKKPSTVYFVAQLDTPMHEFGGWKSEWGEKQVIEDPGDQIKGPDSGGYLRFSFDKPTTVKMKVAISYVSEEQARLNLDTELPHWNFDRVVNDSRDEWNDWLSKIEVEGGTKAHRVKFYTDLWHSLLGRRTYSDVNGKYTDNTGPEPVVRQLPLDKNGQPTRDMYNSDSFWGAEWTITLLWSLAYPDMMNDFTATLLDYYKNGGLIARGPSGGNYTYVMVGDQATPLIAAAYNKGIRNFDIDAAWEGALKNAYPGGIRSHAGYEAGPNATGGGMQQYVDQGWVPVHPEGEGGHREGAAQTLFYAYQDWTLAQFAKGLGKKEQYQRFMDRSGNWKNLWDSETGWIRPKNPDGSWLADFEPILADSFNAPGFVEGNSATFTHYVPHDVNGLIEAFGGPEAYVEQLNEQFEMAKGNRFIAKDKRHAESWVDYSNQPSCQMAHLFNFAGAPWLSQYWVRQVKELTYGDTTPFGGYNGDEDQGLMGALGVLMSVGLFDVQGGADVEPRWEITTPVFDKITIHLDSDYYSGKTFTIDVKGDPTENIYIQSARLNGKPLNRYWITHEEIVNGGKLMLKVGPKPNKEWGVESE